MLWVQWIDGNYFPPVYSVIHEIITYKNYLGLWLYKYLQDDILPKLMTSTGSYEDLFKKEIAKYDHICEEIAQNIEAQEQLLLQIQVSISGHTCK